MPEEIKSLRDIHKIGVNLEFSFFKRNGSMSLALYLELRGGEFMTIMNLPKDGIDSLRKWLNTLDTSR